MSQELRNVPVVAVAKPQSAGRFVVFLGRALGRAFRMVRGAFGFFYPRSEKRKDVLMKGFFYRSYNHFQMCPLTIHCEGMKYKDTTVLSAGFAIFGFERDGVSAYVTLEKCSAETAKELLTILDENMNFTFSRVGDDIFLAE